MLTAVVIFILTGVNVHSVVSLSMNAVCCDESVEILCGGSRYTWDEYFSRNDPNPTSKSANNSLF